MSASAAASASKGPVRRSLAPVHSPAWRVRYDEGERDERQPVVGREALKREKHPEADRASEGKGAPAVCATRATEAETRRAAPGGAAAA